MLFCHRPTWSPSPALLALQQLHGQKTQTRAHMWLCFRYFHIQFWPYFAQIYFVLLTDAIMGENKGQVSYYLMFSSKEQLLCFLNRQSCYCSKNNVTQTSLVSCEPMASSSWQLMQLIKKGITEDSHFCELPWSFQYDKLNLWTKTPFDSAFLEANLFFMKCNKLVSPLTFLYYHTNCLFFFFSWIRKWSHLKLTDLHNTAKKRKEYIFLLSSRAVVQPQRIYFLFFFFRFLPSFDLVLISLELNL